MRKVWKVGLIGLAGSAVSLGAAIATVLSWPEFGGKLEGARTSKKTTSKGAPAARTAVLYARVSSKDQEREGYSIPAQQELLRQYAADQGFRVLEEFVDVETAKRAAALEEMERLSNVDKADLDLGLALLELGKETYDAYIRLTHEQRRALLDLVLLNSTLTGRRLEVTWRELFSFLVNLAETSDAGSPRRPRSRGASKMMVDTGFEPVTSTV